MNDIIVVELLNINNSCIRTEMNRIGQLLQKSCQYFLSLAHIREDQIPFGNMSTHLLGSIKNRYLISRFSKNICSFKPRYTSSNNCNMFLLHTNNILKI